MKEKFTLRHVRIQKRPVGREPFTSCARSDAFIRRLPEDKGRRPLLDKAFHIPPLDILSYKLKQNLVSSL